MKQLAVPVCSQRDHPAGATGLFHEQVGDDVSLEGFGVQGEALGLTDDSIKGSMILYEFYTGFHEGSIGGSIQIKVL